MDGLQPQLHSKFKAILDYVTHRSQNANWWPVWVNLIRIYRKQRMSFTWDWS